MNLAVEFQPLLENLFLAILPIITFIVGYFAALYVRRKIKQRAEDEAERIVEEARREAENLKKEAIWEGREEAERKKEEIEEKLSEERARLEQREEELEEKEEHLEERLENVYEEISELKERREQLEEREETVRAKLREAEKELERVSGLTAEEAREQLRESLVEDAKKQAQQQIKKIEAEARDEAESRARRIVARSLQRCAVEQTTESTVQVVDLPSDDMKGRIIGREGRNIRAFEKVTGVDLIVDDTPEAVSISSFDPIRREIAHSTLKKLILDGRIQPARIEEIYEKTREEIDESIREAGEEGLAEVGVPGVNPELVQRIGQLKYISEAGQNQLEHSVQVAHVAGLIAAEMHADEQMAKRCGILHAIGKTVSHENGQSYAIAGANLAEKHGESEPVVYAIAAHTEERPFKTVEGIILNVANKLSMHRPGARKDKFASFINRMENLEQLARDFETVDDAFAIQAGRELRVIVDDQIVDDEEAEILARDLVDRIQEEIDFPDQIKVSLLREKRVIDYAR